jgi:hypothetical protein
MKSAEMESLLAELESEDIPLERQIRKNDGDVVEAKFVVVGSPNMLIRSPGRFLVIFMMSSIMLFAIGFVLAMTKDCKKDGYKELLDKDDHTKSMEMY